MQNNKTTNQAAEKIKVRKKDVPFSLQANCNESAETLAKQIAYNLDSDLFDDKDFREALCLAYVTLQNISENDEI